jgi:hypothetical protein
LPLAKLVFEALVADGLVVLELLPQPVIKNSPAAMAIERNTRMAAI